MANPFVHIKLQTGDVNKSKKFYAIYGGGCKMVCLGSIFVRLVSIFLLSSFVSGCATFTSLPVSSLYTGITPAIIPPECKIRLIDEEQKVCAIRLITLDRGKEYTNNYFNLSNQSLYLDYGLIALGAGTAAGILYEANRTILSGLALTTATLAGIKTYTSNSARGTIYLSAAKATYCVYANSFNLTILSSAKDSLTDASDKITKNLPKAQTLLKELPVNSSEHSGLTSAITAASAALSQSNQALVIVQNASDKIGNALNNIELKVREQLNTGRPNVNDIVTALQNVAQNKSQTIATKVTIETEQSKALFMLKTSALSKTTLKDIIDSLNDAVNMINTLAKPYTDAGTQIDNCVASF